MKINRIKDSKEYPGFELSFAKNGIISFGDCAIGWKISFILEDFSEKEFTNENMTSFSYKADNLSWECSWKGLKKISDNFEVKAVWKMGGDGLLSGTLSCKGLENKAGISRLHFPVVEFPYEDKCGLLIPSAAGTVIHNADKEIFSSAKYVYPSYNTVQFYAYLGRKTNLYFDTRDTEGYFHESCFKATPEGNAVYEGIYYAPLDKENTSGCSIPYSSSIKVFRGGWYEACRIYKAWAVKQKWAVKRKNNRKLRELGARVWNRGKIDEIIPPIEKLKNDLQLPVALHWYWWHRNPYDTEYPRYLPPREGVEKFKETMKRLERQNIHSEVYVNCVLCDMDDRQAWETCGKDGTVIKKDGSPHSIAYNTFMPHRLAHMCGEASAFQSQIKETARTLHEYGLPGLYLDVLNATNTPCYNPRHKHAPGGGKYQIAGFRKLLEELRNLCPGMLFSSEGAEEFYMDLLDAGLILDAGIERLPIPENYERVPMFSAVYHEFFPIFGNYGGMDGIPPYDPLWPQNGKWKEEKKWHELCPDQYFLEMARCIVWGLQPTIINLYIQHVGSPEFKEEYEFFLRLVRFHHNNLEFLFDGEMLAAGNLEVKEIKVKFLRRFLFTKENEVTTLHKKIPAVLHSRWKSPDGKKALILVNFSQEKISYSWTEEGKIQNGSMEPRSFKAVELQ